MSEHEWLAARRDFLVREKELTRLRDDLSRRRRDLPWVRIEKDYVFDGPDGRELLADLFAGRSQLILYHFMFHPDWSAGCKSCSFWADSFDSIIAHINQRDITMVAISRAPLAKLSRFQQRMGWKFKWLSSEGTDFNRDFDVPFTPSELEAGGGAIGSAKFRGPEAPGLSVFFRDEEGAVFRTYSCYARGLDALNSAYQLLDVAPKGRDEAGLKYGMEWVRLRDEYPARIEPRR